jgi:hypothetical protein
VPHTDAAREGGISSNAPGIYRRKRFLAACGVSSSACPISCQEQPDWRSAATCAASACCSALGAGEREERVLVRGAVRPPERLLGLLDRTLSLVRRH